MAHACVARVTGRLSSAASPQPCAALIDTARWLRSDASQPRPHGEGTYRTRSMNSTVARREAAGQDKKCPANRHQRVSSALRARSRRCDRAGPGRHPAQPPKFAAGSSAASCDEALRIRRSASLAIRQDGPVIGLKRILILANQRVADRLMSNAAHKAGRTVLAYTPEMLQSFDSP